MRPTWLSWHLHEYADHDRLLVECVRPLLRELRQDGQITGAFYIRYWDRGDHVRLRLRPAGNDVGGRVTRAAEAYFAGCPPTRCDAGQHKLLAELEQVAGDVGDVLPDHSCVAAEYRPELDKYGGPGGVAAAEQLFETSTRLVLEVLPNLTANQRERMSCGLLGLLTAVAAADLGPAGAAEFLDGFQREWQRYATPEFIAVWPQNARIHEQVFAVPAGRAIRRELPQPFFRAWGQAVATALEQADPGQRRTFSLLSHYIHTHNNRLGIAPGHEAYLALLGRSLQNAG